MSFFKNISEQAYHSLVNTFKGKKWNLMEESHKYCEQDCITLYQILDKFNLLIFKKFHVNIHTYPTLPSIAMQIFKTNFLKKNSIPLLS